MKKLNIKKILKLKAQIAFEVTKFVGMLGLMLFVSIKAPQIHLNHLRSEVGSKVVKVLIGRSGGTGFYLTTESGATIILTNKHVCGLDINQKVTIKDGKKTYSTDILALSHKHDLCAIHAPFAKKGLKLSSDSAEIGDQIAIIGHPHLTPLAVAKGTYNGTSLAYLPFALELKLPTRLVVGWTDAAAYPGNSGSPVVNFYGNVVGLLFAGSAAHVNMIVPLASVEEFLKGF